MTDPRRGSNRGHETRARIADIALELFLGRGYHETSMQQIADRLGITKAALYYHFASKSDIVGSLIEPLADELDLVLDLAEQADDQQNVRAAVLEGYLDVLIRYRGSILSLMRDVSATPPDFYGRMVRFGERAKELIAGPNASLDERIRATQALSALGDPLVLFPDTPGEELREKILDGAWRLLEEPPDRRRTRQ
ncbi:MAG: TetR/AcrR family transcriptional regulator [Rubrobacteraceae bacterium]